MAIAGDIEQNNRHSLFGIKALSFKETGKNNINNYYFFKYYFKIV